jgi:hypothetical protein
MNKQRGPSPTQTSGPDETADVFPDDRTTSPTDRTGAYTPKSGKPRGDQIGPDLSGYAILEVIGRGGMGVVYKARHFGLDRLVALKMVLAGAHASPEELVRFSIESHAVAQFQRPAIVQIYEVGEHDGLPYFSREFVAGGSLADKIDGKPQPAREAAGMVHDLALAMREAHRHNIIHRDLKPANVLLAGDPKAKLNDIDVMIARARCGQHHLASKTAEELITSSWHDARVYFQAGCGFSLCTGAVAEVTASPEAKALAERYTESAFKSLRLAIGAGWKNLVDVETDPDLDAIRDVPGFADVVTEDHKAVKK